MSSGTLALIYSSIILFTIGLAAGVLIKHEVNEFFSFMNEVNDK
jgi:hypothetical protein